MAFFLRPGRLRPLAPSVSWIALGALVATLGPAASCSSGNSDKSASSSSSTTSGDDTPLPPILDAGGSLPDARDGAAACPHQEVCNFQTGALCSENQTCAPALGDAGLTAQCTAAGTAPIGGPCAADKFYGECVAGAVCISGTCRKLCCDGDWNGCPSGEHCSSPLEINVPEGDASVAQMSGAWICRPSDTCDPLDPASCSSSGAGQSCLIADELGATICAKPPGSGQAGDSCPCDAGFICVGVGCRRLCRAVEGGGEPSCPREEGVCAHFVRDPSGVGECSPTGFISN